MKIFHALVMAIGLMGCLDAAPKPEPTASDPQLASLDVGGLAGGLAAGSRLKLALPGLGQPELVIQTVAHLVPGLTTVSGHLAGDERSDFTLSIEGGKLVGAIRQGTHAWLVEPHPTSDQHVVRMLDRTTLPQQEPDLPQAVHRDAAAPITDGPGVMSAANGTGDVRVLFLHATDVANASAHAANIIASFNSSLTGSAVASNNYLSLAGVQQVASNFAGQSRLTIINAMVARAAPFAGIDAARDAAGADIVFLLVSEDPTAPNEVPGFGRVGGVARRFESNNPFALSTVSYALGDLTALHEIGHVFGGQHENGTGIARPVVAVDDTWMTIMGGYIECPFNGLPATCVRLDRWSNPDLTHNGVPLGVAGQRDMESHLEGAMPTVSGWRTDVVVDPAGLTSPTPGSTLPGSSVTFSWSTGTGVSQYYLYVGSSAGGADLYAASQGTSTAVTVTGLPTDARAIHVRLWSLIGSAWQFRDYTYTAASTVTPAVITSPTPGSTLTGPSATFSWSPGTGVSQYYLYVGTSVGGADLYAASQGLATSRTVTGLPTDGRMLYVRLWSYAASTGWQFRDYSYRAAIVAMPATITSPSPGSTLGASATFTWNPGTGATQYYLYVGSSLGGADLYAASQGTLTSGTVSGLPTDGRTLHVRLWSLIAGSWQYRDYTYTATSSCSPLAGTHGQMWMPVSANSQYVYRDGWCTVGHGLPEMCFEGTYFYYQNLQSSSCSSVGSGGTCYDNDAWWWVTCNSLVDCIYDCSGQCVKADC